MFSYKYKQLNDKEWLIKKHINENQSLEKISKIVGCSVATVFHYLKHFGIETFNIKCYYKYPILFNKDWLHNEYYIKNKTIKEISEIVGCNNQAVRCTIKRYNLPFKNWHNSRKYQIQDFIINNQDVIDGLMLGDGHLRRRSKGGNTELCISQKELELVNYIKNLVCPDRKIVYRKYKWGIYNCYSRVSPTLNKYYDRWYKNKVKIIPSDLVLSPIKVLHWFLGDGYFKKQKNCFDLELCTHCFQKKEVEFLLELFKNIGIMFYLSKKGINKKEIIKYTLRTGRKENIRKFFNYIGPCPVECMKHRWPQNKI